jgi:O-antigen/teichoic acid export membrane protein
MPSPIQLLRYATGNYLGTIFALIYTNLLPLIVANNAGVESAAYFYLPWTISTGLQLIAIHLSTSMTVEAALNPEQLGSYSRRAFIHALRLLLPLVALIFLGAPWFLSIFGKAYSAEGTALLRWLSLAAIPNVVVVVALGLARVQNKSALIALTQFIVCVLALALTYELLPIYGVTGAGVAWLASQTVGALLVGLLLLRPQLQSSPRSALAESEIHPTQFERT